ncbi:hypothetical protein PTSG_10485 [Salpingoeca rosetta]|uniref:SH2 domain-containing protein n=1 Tax=Salpingoeca rosetta (strain ATCC 50818 / BSB-021) TaxID=946362 RepID=F2UPT2_SALR5|nr:uncharacterized protein PTSG_10485 [Salpingoeca rosetta]EGD79637.1 hypothetical protein PTSG_10485 [Salpingoeca rosetta]|eukprot:XP_004988865.1 hypothetical protein PTSG_10485 [Salpingoeca rosetta]
MSYEEDDEDRSYYHGRISRDEAVSRLHEGGKDGSFLLRMSESQDGVYTVSVMQGTAVRHIRVINKDDGGYALSPADPSVPSVWELIQRQMNRTLTNSFDTYDNVALRHPLQAPGSVIAPDLLCKAEEAGMDASEFDQDVAAFLEGGVDSKELVRRRSKKYGPRGKPQSDMVRDALGTVDSDVERFMNGGISANELHRRRSVNTRPARSSLPAVQEAGARS